MEAIGRTIMLTVRTALAALAMLLLVSCGNEPDRIMPAFSIPPDMRAVGLFVPKDSTIAPGDHVDVLVMEKGQENIVLQNAEVVKRYEHVIQIIVSPEDAKRVMQAGERGQFQVRRN